MTLLQKKETRMWGIVHNFGETKGKLWFAICLVCQVSDIFNY